MHTKAVYFLDLVSRGDLVRACTRRAIYEPRRHRVVAMLEALAHMRFARCLPDDGFGSDVPINSRLGIFRFHARGERMFSEKSPLLRC